MPRGVDSTKSGTLDGGEIYRMSGHALCGKLCSPGALPGNMSRETGSSPTPVADAAKHKVNFSMTTRKENSEV